MFAEGDGAPVAIDRNVSDGDERHDDSPEKSCMIRANSTLADARDGSLSPQAKQDASAQQTGRPKPSPA